MLKDNSQEKYQRLQNNIAKFTRSRADEIAASFLCKLQDAKGRQPKRQIVFNWVDVHHQQNNFVCVVVGAFGPFFMPATILFKLRVRRIFTLCLAVKYFANEAKKHPCWGTLFMFGFSDKASPAAILTAIYQHQAVIEFEPDGTIVTTNALFLQLTGYQLNEIRGQQHRMFLDPTQAASAEYQQFWQQLRQGKA